MLREGTCLKVWKHVQCSVVILRAWEKLPEGPITINSIFQWRTPGLQVINWPQTLWVINSRAKNCKVVVSLLLPGMPPAPSTAPAACRASCLAAGSAGSAGGRLACPTLVPAACCCWGLSPALSSMAPTLLAWSGCRLSVFCSLPGTTKSIVFSLRLKTDLCPILCASSAHKTTLCFNYWRQDLKMWINIEFWFWLIEQWFPLKNLLMFWFCLYVLFFSLYCMYKQYH